ncbi:Hypothetical predicted protein [Paramuricea clavata]|uniref:Uncharacterized protein n=1 Tax=Paramuricea clavata TaxID=317549 RepID=A0A6S7GMY7_PARCT|nr:Hypothetical predicted protein [Paramuricea clavata]
MSWIPTQQYRLAVEKEILDRFFPGKVQWIDPTVAGRTRIEIEMTSNSNQVYRLRAYVPPDYPNSLPDLVVAGSPKPMPNWGSHHATHTIGIRDGCLKICHYYAPRWNPEHTFYEIFVKGRVWLEAYEGHLQTGKNLDFYLGHMR